MEQKNALELENNYEPINQEAPDFCRICFEPGPLIFPCKCIGSNQCVHESCLKKWITLKYPEIIESRCEVCRYQYRIEMTTFKKCDPKTAISKRFGYCCFIPILLFDILRSFVQSTKSKILISVFLAIWLSISCSYPSL